MIGNHAGASLLTLCITGTTVQNVRSSLDLVVNAPVILLITEPMRKKNLPTRKMVSMTQEQAQEIDDLRFALRIGSEADLMRELLALGLEAKKAEIAKGKKSGTDQ